MAAKKKAEAPELTSQQRIFVDEYIIDLDVKRAARVAGFAESMMKGRIYDYVSGKQSPQVFNAIQKALAERSQRTRIAADRVLEELAGIAFSDIGVLFDEDGSLKSVKKMTATDRRLIASIELSKGKVKIWDKLAALDKIARHLGMLGTKFGPDAEGSDNAVDPVSISDREVAQRLAFILAKGAKDA